MPKLGPNRTKQNKQNKTKHKQQEKRKAVELDQGRKEMKNKDYSISDEGQITL